MVKEEWKGNKMERAKRKWKNKGNKEKRKNQENKLVKKEGRTDGKEKYIQRMRKERRKLWRKKERMNKRWMNLTATVSICCWCSEQHCSHQLWTAKSRPDLIMVWNTALWVHSRAARINMTYAWLTNENHPYLESLDSTFHKDVGSIINLRARENSGELDCQLWGEGGGWRSECFL